MKYAQHTVNARSGWTKFISPKMKGYKIKCCDCGLVHEMDFRVVKYKSKESLEYKVIADKNTQVHFRARREIKKTKKARKIKK